MNELKKSLRDSAKARWTAMILVSFAMFTGYLFTEIISPLKPMIESDMGWSSSNYALVVSAYGWFNVFLGMLIIVGVLLDKFGIRFSSISSGLIMVLGAGVKYYAFVGNFTPGATIFGEDIRVMIASFGYALFGVGVEYAGITASKAIVKWFKGKEMALAMGMQVAIARLGSFVPLAFGAKLASTFNVSTPILFGFLFLNIGLITFFTYNMLDKKLDIEDGVSNEAASDEDKFKFSDLKVIFYNRGFWYIAILCVLFYSAVFPFYKYGPDLMVNKFGVSEDWAGLIPSLVPFGTIFLTPLFGSIYDKKGKGASMMILGSIILVIVHVIYFLPFITSIWIAVANAILLGIGFSLVPSAMWPSVPKIIPEKQLGSAFATIFWVQNWGLMGIPFAVGVVLDKLNPAVAASKIAAAKALETGAEAVEIAKYDYSKTWLIFIGLTLLAVVFAYLLKAEDKKKGYGLQLPNIKKEA